MRRWKLLVIMGTLSWACQKATPPRAAARPHTLQPAAIARLIVDDDIVDREGWAADVAVALRQADQPATLDAVCQVLAILEQESGYQADPVVPGLGRVVHAELDSVFGKLGPAAAPVRSALLDAVAPGQDQSFEARLSKVRTEAEADRLYREIVAFHQARVPGITRLMSVLAPDLIERHNPITTAGSMQVSVRWVSERPEHSDQDIDELREWLYTRQGGVVAGTARLFETADYAEPIHRFADYNAGAYASRNAGFQARLSTLTGEELVRDGDLLRYGDNGRVRRGDSNSLRAMLAFAAQYAPQLSEAQVRGDAMLEKTAAFAQTPTYEAVSEAFRQKMGRDPAEAIIPKVELQSPKFSRPLTTEWFAQNVDRRYQACRVRGRR